jgi:hypothetical protein
MKKVPEIHRIRPVRHKLRGNLTLFGERSKFEAANNLVEAYTGIFNRRKCQKLSLSVPELPG